MGHLGNLKDEYRELALRLGENVVGLPEPAGAEAHRGWTAILELLYTPEEAAFGALLPHCPATLEEIATLCGKSPESVRNILEPMAEKGVVMDLLDPQTGQTLYSLSPPIVGFFELTMMKVGGNGVSKADLAQAIAAYAGAGPDFVREVHGAGLTAMGRTLVHDGHFNPERLPTVHPWEEIRRIIQNAQVIAVSKCYCRHKAEHLGQHCQAPQEVCLSLNQFGEFVIRRHFGRAITGEEALAILAKSRKHHLVHIVDNVKNQPAWLCNCCSCCCGTLKAIRNHGFPAVNPSPFLPMPDPAACTACGYCIDLCPVSALSIAGDDNSFIRVDPGACIGCGVCVSACPHEALSLTRRSASGHVPDSKLELMVLRALERGKLPALVSENALSHDNAYLDLVLDVIKNLPESQKNLALEQLDSRFIAYMVR